MSTARLMAQLDGARFVRYDTRDDELHAWYGGHGVHIYAANGEEVDYYSVGDFARNDATEQEVREGIARWLNEQD